MSKLRQAIFWPLVSAIAILPLAAHAVTTQTASTIPRVCQSSSGYDAVPMQGISDNALIRSVLSQQPVPTFCQTPGFDAAKSTGQGITKASRGRIKQLVTNLSKPEKNPGLSQEKLEQLRRIADKADAKVRVDLDGVTGTGVKPHAHVEGMGSKVEGRHIWLEEGVQ